jgi:hypothetical protein
MRRWQKPLSAGSWGQTQLTSEIRAQPGREASSQVGASSHLLRITTHTYTQAGDGENTMGDELQSKTAIGHHQTHPSVVLDKTLNGDKCVTDCNRKDPFVFVSPGYGLVIVCSLLCL